MVDREPRKITENRSSDFDTEMENAIAALINFPVLSPQVKESAIEDLWIIRGLAKSLTVNSMSEFETWFKKQYFMMPERVPSRILADAGHLADTADEGTISFTQAEFYAFHERLDAWIETTSEFQPQLRTG